jgi:cyanate permease
MTALVFTNSLVLPMLRNWRNVFLGYGAFGLAVTLIWILLGRRPHAPSYNTPKDAIKKKEKHGLIWKHLWHRNIWIIVVIGAASFLTNHALKNWLPSILELKGLSSVDAGYATSLLAISGIFGSLIIPKVSYRISSRKLMIALILFLSGVSILFISVGEIIIVLIGLFSTGFLMRAITPLLLLTLMEMSEVGTEHMGSVGGLYFSMGEIGGFLGPFMMGYIKDLTGSFLFGIYALTIITWAAIFTLGLLRADSD